LRLTRAWKGLPAIKGSLEVLLLSGRARIRLA
jgi:hypothetical protein